MAKEIELTSDRDMVGGTAPYQPRPTIRVNRKVRVRVGYILLLRPRTAILALLALGAAAWALWRLLFGAGR